MPTHLLGLLATIIPVSVQFVVFLRWIHRRMRADEIMRAFVRDLAVTHLPHIYAVLQEIGKRQGTKVQETPVVRYSDLNGHRRPW